MEDDIIVDIPGISEPVRFPSSMSEAEINAASKRLYDEAMAASAPPPEDTRTFGQQFRTGITKRFGEIGSGLKEKALRVATGLGITDPEELKKFEDEFMRTQTVMANIGQPESLYQRYKPSTGPEILGSLAADISTLAGANLMLKPLQYGASMVRGGKPVESAIEYTRGALVAPKTATQAALGGGLYAQTIPYESTGDLAQSTAISAGVSAALNPVMKALGLSPQDFSKLTPAQQQAAKRAVEAGFQFTPGQMTGSKTSMFIEEGIKALPLARSAFTKLEDANQEALQKIAAESIGLKPGLPLTPQAMEDAYLNALSKYKSLETIPSIKLDKAFGQEIDNILQTLQSVPKQQRSEFKVAKIEAILNGYKDYTTKALDGKEMFQGLKATGDQLFKAQKEGTIVAAAYKDLRAAFENAIERAIQAPSKKNLVSPDVVKNFKEGRTQMSNWFTVDEAFNPATGQVSGPKIASSLERKSNFGGRNTALETAALAVRAFPRALPSSGTAERAESAGLVKQIGAGLIGGGVAGAATQDPYTAASVLGASQLAPALVGRMLTSEPVRSTMARRQFGAIAPDEGLAASLMRRFETYTPEAVRFGAGDLARIYAQQAATKSLLD